MRTADGIICDHHTCHKKILTPEDNEIVGNCNFHVECWERLQSLSFRDDSDSDMRVLFQIEFLNQEGGGNA